METIFGPEGHLLWYHGAARAILIFFYGLVSLRLSGRRTFANMSALDIVISVVAGSALSETMTGSAPLPSTLTGVAVIIFLHVLAAYAAASWKPASRLLEGGSIPLMRRGRLNDPARRRHMISIADLEEALRQHGLLGLDEIPKVKSIHLEPNGELTIIKKNDN